MNQGKDAEACPKLAESQRLDPSLGTLLRLATCYEKIGKTASAWGLYGDAVASAKAAGQEGREKYAAEHVKALEPKLCKVTIEVPKDADLDGLEVRRDGEVISRAQWGTAVPVDPGNVSIEARAPGRQTFKKTISLVGDGKRETIKIPVLEAASSEPAPVVDESSGTRRTIGLVVGAVGVVGVAVGSIYGLKAMSRNDESSSHCRTSNLCDADGLSLRDDAKKFATISTVFFIVGGVALATGAVLVLTEKPSSSKVVVGVSLSGVSLAGSF